VGDIAFLPGITGKYYCVTTYYIETGKVGHGIEDFYIVFWQGNEEIGTVTGYDKVISVNANWKVRANGWITDASDNFAYLIGCKFQYELTFIDPTVIPILSIGTCFFAGV